MVTFTIRNVPGGLANSPKVRELINERAGGRFPVLGQAEADWGASIRRSTAPQVEKRIAVGRE